MKAGLRLLAAGAAFLFAGGAAAASAPARTVYDVKLFVQFDFPGLTEATLPERIRDVRLAGADGVTIALTEFFEDGERRVRSLARLKTAIAAFEREGFPVAVWTTSLGYGVDTDRDLIRRIPRRQALVSFNGKSCARCPTDLACRAAVCENVRDFIRAGAKFILWDDDLVQSCRPGLGCVCPAHMARLEARLGRAVTTNEVACSLVGASNAVRSAYLDVNGEALTEYCRAVRAAADGVDPSVGMGICASWTHYDCEGVEFRDVAKLLAGGGRRPFIRASGATYWPIRSPRCRGLHLGSVMEFVRWQIAEFRGTDVRLLDENDPYPRSDRLVPAKLCELYDKVMVAEGDIVRNKYILRDYEGKIDPAYLAAHLENREEAVRLGTLFAGTGPCGFKVIYPRHQIRAATIPPGTGMWAVAKAFSLPMAGVLVSLAGVPVHYERGAETPAIAFGERAALALTEDDFRRGVILDAEGAKTLSLKGVDVGREDGSLCRLYRNAAGGRFAILKKSHWDIDYTAKFAAEIRFDEIWSFFTGKTLPLQVAGAPGVYLLAKERRDGALAVLLCNMEREPTGRFAVKAGSRESEHRLGAYAAESFLVR